MPEIVVLRGDFAINRDPNVVICSPNATNGDVISISGNDFSAMIHVDNENNLKDLKKILSKLSKFDPNFKCTIMGRDSGDLRGQVTDLLKEFNPGELNQETWSGSHSYNITLAFDGTISVDNSPSNSRKHLNSVIFSEGGEERLSEAISGKPIPKLKSVMPEIEMKPVRAVKLQGAKNLGKS